MAKGDVCPRCGKQTFHRDKGATPEGARKCSQCGARGWLGHPDPMLGRGRACKNCGQNLVRVVATTKAGTEVQFCYGCGAAAFE